MVMYRVVFSGELLAGFDPAGVRAAVAERLQLGAAQVERMFSGRPVVLKKMVSAANSQPYLDELKRLGLDARLEQIAEPEQGEKLLATFKVVFWGRTLRGFERALVMRAAARRLHINPQQLVTLFSGAKAVLKRGVSAEVGARYVTELARIGMLVELEVETEALAPVLQPASLPPDLQGGIPAPAPVVEESFSGLLTTQLDMSAFALRTSLGDANELGRLAEGAAGPASEPPPQPVPPIFDTAPAVVATPDLAAVAGAPTPAAPAQPLVQCPQCGHRQPARPRCRACGMELTGIGKKARRKDASAFDPVSTIMGGIKRAMTPKSTTGESSRTGVPTWMFEIRDAMDPIPEPRRFSLQWIVLSATGLVLMLGWYFFLR